jgi:hypothetical protein
LGGKIWAEKTQIKVYFVLKSLLLKPMKLKRSPTTASEVHFEPQKLKNTCCRR